MVWPILAALGSMMGAAGGGAAAAGGAAGGGGMMGQMGGLLGGMMSKDGMENAASQPGSPGMPLQSGQGSGHMHAPDVSRDGMIAPMGLIDLARSGAGPGRKRNLQQLTIPGLIGLLGGG